MELFRALYGGGAALRERGRTLGAPAPGPGPRVQLRAPTLPPAPPSPHAHRSRMAAPAPAGGAGAGAGAMGFVMPLYTAAVLVFFLYTLSKVVMKRPGPPPVPSSTFREHVFNQQHHLVTDAVWGLCADVNRHHSNLRQHSPESNHSQQNGNVDQTQRKLDRLLESDQEQQEDIREIKKVDLEEDTVSKPLEIKQVLEQIQLEEKQQLEKQHLEEKQLLEQRMHELELERLRREEEQRELEQLQIDEKEFEVEEKPQANGSAPQMAEETTIEDEVKLKNEETAVKSESEEECVEEEEEEIEEEEEEEEGERSTLKVVGFETVAHAADGAPVPLIPPVPPLPQPPAEGGPRAPGAAADVSEIYLQGGAVPYAGRVLVAALGDPRPAHTNAPLVVSGKMTLSLIPDDETKVEEQDTETLDFKSLDEVQDEEIEEEVEEELEEEVEMEEELEEVKDSGAKSIENEETRSKLVTLEYSEPYQQEVTSKDKELTYEDIVFDNQDVLASANARLVPQIESDFSTVKRELIDSDECIIKTKNNNQEIEEKLSNNHSEETGKHNSQECEDLAAEAISEPYKTDSNLTQNFEGLFQAPLALDPETVNKGTPDASEINVLQSDMQEETIINITKPAQLVHQFSDLSQETVIECENEGIENIIDLETEDFQRLYEANLGAAEELITSVQISNPQVGDPPLILESESEADNLGSNENFNSASIHIADEEPLSTILTLKTDHSELEQKIAIFDNPIEKTDRQSTFEDKDEENEVPNLESTTLEIIEADEEDQPQSLSRKNESAGISAADEEDIQNNHGLEKPSLLQDSEIDVAYLGGSGVIKESDDHVETFEQVIPESELRKTSESEPNVNSKVSAQTISLTDSTGNFEPEESEQISRKAELENLKSSEEKFNLYETIETPQHSDPSPETPQSEDMSENFKKSEYNTLTQTLPVVVNPDNVETDQIIEDIVNTEQTQVSDTKTQIFNQQVTDIDDADSEFDRLLTELGDETVKD